MKQFIAVLVFACCLAIPARAQTTNEIIKGNCKTTAQICQQTANYCNRKRGPLGEVTVLNAIKDCLTSCKTTDEYLSRGSGLAPKSSLSTEQACNELAKVCDRFPNDSQMTTCANECRKTASNLQKMTK